MSLMQHFHNGGFAMYFILVFAILTVAFIIERSIALFGRYKDVPKDFRKTILSFIVQGDMKGAASYIELSASKTSLGRVALVGCKMKANGSGDEALQARMDEQLSREISATDKRTGFLAMFGNVATLLGLMGTVTGMISSFAGASAASPVERANLLSLGISEALSATAFGLMAAIPALVAYAIFQNRTDKITSKLTEDASEIYHDFLFYAENEDKQGLTKFTKPVMAKVEATAQNSRS